MNKDFERCSRHCYFSCLFLLDGCCTTTYNKQRVQGKNPLLEQHLDGDISNAYLAVTFTAILFYFQFRKAMRKVESQSV